MGLLQDLIVMYNFDKVTVVEGGTTRHRSIHAAVKALQQGVIVYTPLFFIPFFLIRPIFIIIIVTVYSTCHSLKCTCLLRLAVDLILCFFLFFFPYLVHTHTLYIYCRTFITS